MERKSSLKLRIISSVFFLLICINPFFSLSSDTTIRFPLWVLLDSYPGLETENSNITISEIMHRTAADMKVLAHFIVEGMIYGWEFSYTPSDKIRNVKEYFLFNPIMQLAAENTIHYTDLQIQDNRLTCWVEFNPSSEMLKRRQHWTSILYPKITGKGYADISNGIEGIKGAYSAAILDAIREYVRTLKRNKPKEINGYVLITELPRMYIDNGKYVVDVKYFLKFNEIVPYVVF